MIVLSSYQVYVYLHSEYLLGRIPNKSNQVHRPLSSSPPIFVTTTRLSYHHHYQAPPPHHHHYQAPPPPLTPPTTAVNHLFAAMVGRVGVEAVLCSDVGGGDDD
ncbi:hypothetical protein Tco_1334549 [Tanacetum coccineum]